MRRTLGVVVSVVLCAPLYAADVKTKEITFRSGKDDVKGFLAMPEGKGPFPAIIVIQEWWGLNDWIKENTKRFAEKGYVALAPDLYHGKVTDDPRMARELLMGLPADRAVRDCKSAIDVLTAMDNVDKSKIGSIGWCMGGGYSLQAALKDDRIKACVMCYGRVVTSEKDLKTLHASVLGIFGEDDRGIPAANVRKFESALKDAEKKVEKVHIFKGAGHGFMREKNGERENPEYRAEQAKTAWEEIDKFFAKTLKGK
jgi:carboxymethylenebutenolidase